VGSFWRDRAPRPPFLVRKASRKPQELPETERFLPFKGIPPVRPPQPAQRPVCSSKTHDKPGRTFFRHATNRKWRAFLLLLAPVRPGFAHGFCRRKTLPPSCYRRTRPASACGVMRSASLMMTTFQPLPLKSAAGACAAAGLRPRGRPACRWGSRPRSPSPGRSPVRWPAPRPRPFCRRRLVDCATAFFVCSSGPTLDGLGSIPDRRAC